MKEIEELFDLRTLKSKYRNPRKIGSDELERLKKSVTQFEKMLAVRPIAYDPGSMEVLGGNQRLKALMELGKFMVPVEWVKSVGDMTEDEKKRFVVTDNSSFGEWDMDILNHDYDSADLENWGMDIEELNTYLEAEKNKLEAQEDDFEIPREILTGIQLGDFFEIGDHRLLCGDSTKLETFRILFTGGGVLRNVWLLIRHIMLTIKVKEVA